MTRLLFGGVVNTTVRRCRVVVARLLNGVKYQTGSHVVKTDRMQIKVTERMSSNDLGLFYSQPYSDPSQSTLHIFLTLECQLPGSRG